MGFECSPAFSALGCSGKELRWPTHFAINDLGDVSVLSGTGLVAQTYPLTVRAANVAGGGTGQVSIVVALSAAPVITTTSLFAMVPTHLNDVIGTVIATNAPTSWAIDPASDPSGYCSINNSGVIRATQNAADHFTAGVTGTIPLTVQATNLGGTGSATVTVNYVTDIPITGIILSNTTLANMGAYNAGAVIGQLTLDPPGAIQHTPIVIGGASAALFGVTNGGWAPCNFVAAVNIPAGDYSGVTFTAT